MMPDEKISLAILLSLLSPCLRTLAILSLLAAAPLTLSAQGGNSGAAARGRVQFQKSCSFCHGPDATGGTEGPSLTLSSLVRHDKEGELIGTMIREGRPTKGMPAFPLSQVEIGEIVSFLHARIAELDRRSAGKPPATYALERLLTGNAEAGKKFFTESCSTCHSPTGDLAGIAKKYPPVELQTRFLYPQDGKQTAEIQPPSGPRMKGEIVHSDAFTIAITDDQGWYHSWPRESVSVTVNDPLLPHRKLLDIYTEADMHNVFAYLETLR